MSGGHIHIEGELTVFAVHALKEQLLEAMRAHSAVQIDLSGVSEVDGAGIQLLMATKREAQQREIVLTLSAPSPTVQEALNLCDLTHELEATA